MYISIGLINKYLFVFLCIKFSYVEELNLQMVVGKARVYDGVVNRQPGFDLLIFDCPENLPVPDIGGSNHIPYWNADKEYFTIYQAFTFASKHLQDDGRIVLFHSWGQDSLETIAGLLEEFPNIRKMKEWMGMNRMHLTSAVQLEQTVLFSKCFKIFF